MDKLDMNIGGSIFWVSLILISLSGLLYLLLWSFQKNSVKGTIISLIFFAMIVSGILLSRLKIFDMSSWSDNALSFMLGFGIWMGLGTIFKGSMSVVGVPKNYLFATISSELPVFLEMIFNNFIVPISEEIFWMIGIPFSLVSIFIVLGKKYKIFKNDLFQILVISIIASLTFAYFHVGKIFTAFIISAIIFRTIMIVLIMGESKLNIVKGINIVAGFSVGSHMANNILDTGVQKTWLILGTNFTVQAIIVIFFALLFITAINRVLELLMVKKEGVPI